MPFFENLGSAITDAAKAVSNKTTEVVEVTKLNNKVSECNKGITEAYIQIGKLVYEQFNEAGFTDERFMESCERISNLENEVAQLKEKISNAKGVKVCPGCQASVSVESNFCPKCGCTL